jgi:hypothetical protein
MNSKRSQEGWLLIDNRHGPAVSPEAARASGKDVIGAGVNGVFESALITCAHCQRTVILNPQRDRPRGYCRNCDHYICDSPSCNAACTPMKKLLDMGQEIIFAGRERGNPVQIEAVIDKLRRDILR